MVPPARRAKAWPADKNQAIVSGMEKGKDQEQPGATPPQPTTPKKPAKTVREIGGRKGPDPTRYGDWEVNGRCVDF